LGRGTRELVSCARDSAHNHGKQARMHARDGAPSAELRPEPEAGQAGSNGDEQSSGRTKGGGAAQEEVGEGRSMRAGELRELGSRGRRPRQGERDRTPS
jgi:hypothetical protein